MYHTELKQIEKVQLDSYNLQQKINYLQNMNKKQLKRSKKKRTTPIGQNTLFKREKNKYEFIDSKIDLDAEKVKQEMLNKTQNNIKLKIDYELEECTFKPEINVKSKFIAEKDYIPIQEKEKKMNVQNITEVNRFKKKKVNLSHKKHFVEKIKGREQKKCKGKVLIDSKMTNKKLVSKLEKMYKKL